MHADITTLLADVERPGLAEWERRAVLTVLEQLADHGPLTFVDRIRYDLVRQRVLRQLARSAV